MCQNETRDIRALLTKAVDTLEGMVWQHCRGEVEGELDSLGVSADTEAIELLIRLGRLEKCEETVGRRVFARRRDGQRVI